MEKLDVFGDIKKSSDKIPAFGIDLGTTNSCISVIREGQTPEIIKLDNGTITLPSCVMWKGQPGKFVVGVEAYINRYKENVIYSVKRLMGSGKTVTLKYGGKTLEMTPAEVSAEILKELVKQASKDYGNIKDVVITVPAYFNNSQVNDTIEAGRLAGLNVLSILREPTSGALVYNLDKTEKQEDNVLVYDLGGGTFDTSLVRITKQTSDEVIDDIYNFEEEEASSDVSHNSILTVLRNEGDTLLGGDDIDNELYKIFESRIADLGYDVKFIPRDEKERLKLEMEKIKKSGVVATYGVPLDFKLNDVEGTRVKTTIMVNPEDFKKATKVIYDKTKSLVKMVLAGGMDKNISSIVLIGGSTKNPFIQEFLSRDFRGVEINSALNPDESVALGAGIQAKRLKFGSDTLEVFDVTPLAIGILADGMVNKLIERNQVVPYRYSQTFTTTKDDQSEVNIVVYEGNSPIPEECHYLGNLIVKDIPKGKAGKVAVPVTLSVDANGVLTCSVTVKDRVESVKLVNLLSGEKSNKVDLSDKTMVKITRWKRFASTLEEAKKIALNTLIEGFVDGTVTEDEVATFIRDNRPTVKNKYKTKDEDINKDSVE